MLLTGSDTGFVRASRQIAKNTCQMSFDYEYAPCYLQQENSLGSGVCPFNLAASSVANVPHVVTNLAKKSPKTVAGPHAMMHQN